MDIEVLRAHRTNQTAPVPVPAPPPPPLPTPVPGPLSAPVPAPNTVSGSALSLSQVAVGPWLGRLLQIVCGPLIEEHRIRKHCSGYGSAYKAYPNDHLLHKVYRVILPSGLNAEWWNFEEETKLVHTDDLSVALIGAVGTANNHKSFVTLACCIHRRLHAVCGALTPEEEDLLALLNVFCRDTILGPSAMYDDVDLAEYCAVTAQVTALTNELHDTEAGLQNR